MSVSFNAQNSVFESMRSSRPVKSPTFTAKEEIPKQETQPAQDEVVKQEPAEPKKKTSLFQKFKNAYASVKKGFITFGQYTVGTVKGALYGGAGAVGIIGVDAIINTVKKAPKAISTKGKVIAGAFALATMAYQLFNAHLNANEKCADVDHRWTSGHNQK